MLIKKMLTMYYKYIQNFYFDNGENNALKVATHCSSGGKIILSWLCRRGGTKIVSGLIL